jgi:hypothetical protein
MDKIIHQIWVGPYEMPDLEREYVNGIRHNNTMFDHILWTNDNLPTLPSKLKRIYDEMGTREDYAFQADILRLFVVYEFGGLYLDVDFKPVGSFDTASFVHQDGVFFYHQSTNPEWGADLTSPNGIFGAKKHSDIIGFMIDSIDEKDWWVGPSWMGKTIRKYFSFSENTSHDELSTALQQKNFSYYPFHLLEQNYVKHLALASWIPEHRTHFKNGNVNFQKGKK